MKVTFDRIKQAREEIKDAIECTPCIHSRTLSKQTGAEIVLKFENLQFTGSFKDRGALVKLLSLSNAEKKMGVIAMSAGNHAQAVAYHAQRLGVAATIVMPKFTPTVKVEHTRAYGAEIILEGEGLAEAAKVARRLAKQKGYTLIHPYDDPLIIAGQGTIALEILEEFNDLDYLVIPIGGGGLIAGNAIASKTLRPQIQIIGVETARYPTMLNILQGKTGKLGPFSIAEGIAVKEPGHITRNIVKENVDDILLVEESEIEESVRLLLEVEKSVVEGAGAVGLAAVEKYKKKFYGKKVGIILSGGNIDMSILSSIIQRGLVRTCRLVKMHVDLRDVPGALANVTHIIGECGANIVQIAHQRTFTQLPLQLADVELVLHLRGADHAEEVLAALKKAGYAANLEPGIEKC